MVYDHIHTLIRIGQSDCVQSSYASLSLSLSIVSSCWGGRSGREGDVGVGVGLAIVVVILASFWGGDRDKNIDKQPMPINSIKFHPMSSDYSRSRIHFFPPSVSFSLVFPKGNP